MSKLNVLFKMGSLLAIFCWLLLIFFPAFTAKNSQYILIPIGLLSVLYFYVLLVVKNQDGVTYPKGSFKTLEGVVSLFKNPRAVLVGWVHYLAFDLMVGLYIKHEATQIGLSHWLQVPCFLLTLMYGPLGLLLFFAIKLFYVHALI